MLGTKNILIQQSKDAEVTELCLIRDGMLENMRSLVDASKRMYFAEEIENIAFKQYEQVELLVEDYYKYYEFMDNVHLRFYYQEIQSINLYLYNDTITDNSKISKINTQIMEQDWYQRTIKAKGKVVWSNLYNPSSEKKSICLTRLITTGSGEDVGVVKIYMRNDKIALPIHNRETETMIILNEREIVEENVLEQDYSEIIKILDSNQKSIVCEHITYKGKDCVLTSVRIQPDNTLDYYDVVSIRPYNDILQEANERSKKSIQIIIGSIIVSISMILVFSIHFSKRINTFKNEMHKAANGEFEISNVIGGQDEISDLYKDLGTMIISIQGLICKVYEEQMQREQLYSRQKEVEFKMLASQINPHFLYNTLETIRMKALCNKQPEIEELVKMLAKIIRRNIQVGENFVSMQSELEVVEYYLKIQQYRFGERIKFYFHIEDSVEHIKILPLLIQPVVENAFIHGLEKKQGEGTIQIYVYVKDEIIIRVEDDGVGISEEKLDEIKELMNQSTSEKQEHIGLANVNQRIKLLYGEQYGLWIKSTLGDGTIVEIRLPNDRSIF